MPICAPIFLTHGKEVLEWLRVFLEKFVLSSCLHNRPPQWLVPHQLGDYGQTRPKHLKLRIKRKTSLVPQKDSSLFFFFFLITHLFFFKSIQSLPHLSSQWWGKSPQLTACSGTVCVCLCVRSAFAEESSDQRFASHFFTFFPSTAQHSHPNLCLPIVKAEWALRVCRGTFGFQ